MNSPSKKFLQLILINKRYWFLLLIFFILFIYGKKVGLPRDLEQPFYRPAFLERTNAILINTTQEGYIAQNAISTVPGQSYRIIFSYAVNEDTTKDKLFLQDVKENNFLDINIISKGGKEKKIDKFEITKLNSWQTHEVIFTADDYYNSIYFKKDIPINTKVLLISNIEIDTFDSEDFRMLNKGNFGDIEVFEGQEISNMKNRDILIGFNKKPMSFIQTFMAENEYFYGIDIAMKFFGNGGEGNYKLEIVALDEQNQELEDLNSVQFNTSAEQTNQISPSVYRFVLPAKLTKGQKYGLKISNDNVIIGFMHHLQIYGEKSHEENNIAYSINKNDIKKQIGQSAIKPLYLERTIIENETQLIDSRIREINKNISFFSYNFANRDENILDIYQTNTIVYLDKELEAFSAKYKDGNEFFIIKVWTKYPINQLNFKADQYENTKAVYSVVEYSFDNQGWYKIEPYENSFSNSFNVSILPDIPTSLIYFKISPEKQNHNFQNEVFGISKLTIDALLDNK